MQFIELSDAYDKTDRLSKSSFQISNDDELIQDLRLSIAMPDSVARTSSTLSTFMRILHGHSDCVRTMAIYLPCDNSDPLLVTGGDDGLAIIWNIRTCAIMKQLDGVHTKRIRQIAANETYEKNGFVVTASDDKTAAVWDIHSGNLLHHLKNGGHRWFLTGVAILASSTPLIVTSSFDRFCLVWDSSSGEVVGNLGKNNSSDLSTAVIALSPVVAVASFASTQLRSILKHDASNDAPFILTVGYDRRIIIWDSSNGMQCSSYLGQHSDIISSVAVLVDEGHGLYALTGSLDRTALTIDLTTGEVLRKLEGHTASVTSVAITKISSGRPYLALGLTGCQDGTAILWDLVGGLPIRTFEKQRYHVHKQLSITSVLFVPKLPENISNNKNTVINSTCAKEETTIRNDIAQNNIIDNSCTLASAFAGKRKSSVTKLLGSGTKATTTIASSKEGNSSNEERYIKIASGTTTSDSVQGQSDDTNSCINLFPLIIIGSEDHTVVIWDLDCESVEYLVPPPSSSSFSTVETEKTTPTVEMNKFTNIVDNHTVPSDYNYYNDTDVIRSTDNPITAAATFSSREEHQKHPMMTTKPARTITTTTNSNNDNVIDKIMLSAVVQPMRSISPTTSNSSSTFYTGKNNKRTFTGSKATTNGDATTTASTTSSTNPTDWMSSLAVFAPCDGRRPIVISGGSQAISIVWDLLSGQPIRYLIDTNAAAMSAEIIAVSIFESSHTSLVNHPLRKQQPSQQLHETITTTSRIHHYDKNNNNNNKSALDSVWNKGNNNNDGYDWKPCTATSGSALLAVACSIECTAVWDIDSGVMLFSLTGHHTDHISSMALSIGNEAMNYAFVVTGCLDSTVTIWNLHTGTAFRNLSSKGGLGHCDAVTCIAIYTSLDFDDDDNGHPLIVTGSCDTTAVVWDACTGAVVRTLKGVHNDRVKCVTVYEPNNSSMGGAVVITGGYDKKAVVWDLKSGNALRVLDGGHTNWITAVTVSEPLNIGGIGGIGRPFVVTGGFDGVPILWDLQTGKIIGKLEGGHSNGIRALVSYAGVPLDRGRQSPVILSTGHDGWIAMWDSHYPFQCMPPKSTVQRLFILDAAEPIEKAWPRLTILAEQHQLQLFTENRDLFKQACLLHRSDFLSKFKTMLVPILCGLDDIVDGQSMLRYAIDSRDLVSVRVLLKCWVENLNRPCVDAVHFNHNPLIPKDDVLELGKVYPAEFSKFVCSLHLVPIEHKDVVSGHIDASNTDDPDEGNAIIKGCDSASMKNIWNMFDVSVSQSSSQSSPSEEENKELNNDDIYNAFWRNITALLNVKSSKVNNVGISNYYDDQNEENRPVSLSFVPLSGAASFEMLDMYIRTSVAVGNVDIFRCDAVLVSIRYAWKHFGLNHHVQCTIRFFSFLVLYTLNIIIFDEYISDGGSFAVIAWIIQTLTFLALLARVYYITSGMHLAKGKNLLVTASLLLFQTYQLLISSFWNSCEVLSTVGCFLSIGARFVYGGESNFTKSLLAISTILLWFKALFYLRPLRAYGPIVTMILAITYEARSFMVVAVITLAGFAQAFWLLSSHDDISLPFSTIPQALLSCFAYMMGNFETTFEGTIAPVFSTLVVVVYMWFMVILMLNLLIAMMGNTFSAISENGLAQWRFEQVSIMIDEKFMLGKHKLIVPECVCMLTYTSDYEHYVEERTGTADNDYDETNNSKRNGNAINVFDGSEPSEKLEANTAAALNNTVDELNTKIGKLENTIEDLNSKLDLILSKLVK